MKRDNSIGRTSAQDSRKNATSAKSDAFPAYPESSAEVTVLVLQMIGGAFLAIVSLGVGLLAWFEGVL